MPKTPGITADRLAELELKEVLSTPGGRSVYWRIITLCGVWAPVTTVNGQQQWQEGRRSIGITLMEDAERINPNLVPLMMQEEINRKMATVAKESNR